MYGLRIIVDGDSNDYVGKGLSGAEIIVSPQGRTPIDGHDSAIIGNTCLYGATKGSLMAAGRAGERFAVRNSGAQTVVEGCGAGMTGGMAYIYDEDDMFEKAVNPDSVIWQRFDSEHYEEECKDLIRKHAAQTGSNFSKKLLNEWDLERGKFWQVIPKEMLSRLDIPLSQAAAE